jgi:hypothetical protein
LTFGLLSKCIFKCIDWSLIFLHFFH